MPSCPTFVPLMESSKLFVCSYIFILSHNVISCTSTICIVKPILNFILGIFEDSDVTHVMDSIDPIRDLEIIQEELILKDVETVTKEIAALEKVVGREKHRKPELVLSFNLVIFAVLIYGCRKYTRSALSFWQLTSLSDLVTGSLMM